MVQQTIVVDFPPNYDEIAAVFRIHSRRDVIFAFGPRLFNPYNLAIPDHLIAHEAVHGGRQGTGQAILDWWKQYLEDRAFRLVEETAAHRAEYRWLMTHGNRKERRRAMNEVSGRLASPLYGSMILPVEARRLLEG